jgi:hypothetical protein
LPAVGLSALHDGFVRYPVEWLIVLNTSGEVHNNEKIEEDIYWDDISSTGFGGYIGLCSDGQTFGQCGYSIKRKYHSAKLEHASLYICGDYR